MTLTSCKRFDNVIFRVRGGRCVVSSAAPPFRTAFWPDIRAIGRDLGLEECPAAAWEQPETQEQFLTALARQVPGAQAFRPGTVGFLSPPAEIRRREQLREWRAALTFLGLPSRDVVLGALECAANRLKGRAFVEVGLTRFDGHLGEAVRMGV